MEKNTFDVRTSNGSITADKKLGNVVTAIADEDEDAGILNITRFDIEEFLSYYKATGMPDSVDILVLGYWYKSDNGIKYEPPA